MKAKILTAILLGPALLIAGNSICAAQVGFGIQYGYIDLPTPMGGDAAYYVISQGNYDFGDVRVWSGGAYLGNGNVPLVGFDLSIRNDSDYPIGLDMNRTSLNVVMADGRTAYLGNPYSVSGPYWVDPGDIQNVEFVYAMPPGLPTDYVDEFDLNWSLDLQSGIYGNTTTFRPRGGYHGGAIFSIFWDPVWISPWPLFDWWDFHYYRPFYYGYLPPERYHDRDRYWRFRDRDEHNFARERNDHDRFESDRFQRDSYRPYYGENQRRAPQEAGQRYAERQRAPRQAPPQRHVQQQTYPEAPAPQRQVQRQPHRQGPPERQVQRAPSNRGESRGQHRGRERR